MGKINIVLQKFPPTSNFDGGTLQKPHCENHLLYYLDNNIGDTNDTDTSIDMKKAHDTDNVYNMYDMDKRNSMADMNENIIDNVVNKDDYKAKDHLLYYLKNNIGDTDDTDTSDDTKKAHDMDNVYNMDDMDKMNLMADMNENIIDNMVNKDEYKAEDLWSLSMYLKSDFTNKFFPNSKQYPVYTQFNSPVPINVLKAVHNCLEEKEYRWFKISPGNNYVIEMGDMPEGFNSVNDLRKTIRRIIEANK